MSIIDRTMFLKSCEQCKKLIEEPDEKTDLEPFGGFCNCRLPVTSSSKEPKMNSELEREIPQPYLAAITLLETIAEHGMVNTFEDGTPTPNAKLCLETAEKLRAALSTEAQPEVTGAVTIRSKFGDMCMFRSTSIKKGQTVYISTEPPSAIQAAVREKLEEAATMVAERKTINWLEAAALAKDILALMESPQPSVEAQNESSK